jgi:hypothetical protein
MCPLESPPSSTRALMKAGYLLASFLSLPPVPSASLSNPTSHNPVLANSRVADQPGFGQTRQYQRIIGT